MMTLEAGEERPVQALELARLKWRCRRGMLELDLLLQPFVENRYSTLSDEEKVQFHELLELGDQQLLGYLLKKEEPENGQWANVISKIRDSV